jgi:hypothetical protein
MHQGMTLGLDVVPWVPLAKHILTSLAFSAFLAPTVSQYFSLHISSYFLLVSREGIYLSALGLIVRSHVNLLSLSYTLEQVNMSRRCLVIVRSL